MSRVVPVPEHVAKQIATWLRAGTQHTLGGNHETVKIWADTLDPAEDPSLGERLDVALDDLEDMVQQHCYERDGVYDTGALSTNRAAFDLLVAEGRAEYVGEPYGRMASIRFTARKEES